MTELARVRTVITGFPGQPGLSTQYFRKVSGSAWTVYDSLMTGQIRDAWTTALSLFTTQITLTVLAEIDVIEDSTGEILQTLTGTQHVVQGTDAGADLPPSNAIALTYTTNGVVNGKHVRGRTFLSPLAQYMSDTSGTPTAAALTAANDFATTYIGAGTSVAAVIWSRPKKTVPPATPGFLRFGSNHDITGHYVKDQFAVLRSRRD